MRQNSFHVAVVSGTSSGRMWTQAWGKERC